MPHSTHDTPFFKRNPPRPLPSFNLSEVILGSQLGQGDFGVVLEVMNLVETGPTKTGLSNVALMEASYQQSIQEAQEERKRSESELATQSAAAAEAPPVPEPRKNRKTISSHDSRSYLTHHCMHEGHARFAVKRLRDSLTDDVRREAVLDLASEAKFLSSIKHTNIVRLRATVGHPGQPNFMLVMDRLYSTMEEKWKEWGKQEEQTRGNILGFGKNKEQAQRLLITRLFAMFDVARALRYLHRHNIIYRDMKPHNLAYDVRNVMRLFDFGLAKELLEKDLVKPPNGYEATGMTGSRRYMAPEVCLCQPYGLPADVYSFAILFWQVCAMKIPYDGFTAKQHVERVVLKAERPKKLTCISKQLNKFLQKCWHTDPNQRPSFVEICDRLQSELQVLRYCLDSKAVMDRSIHLWNKSLQSETDFVVQTA